MTQVMLRTVCPHDCPDQCSILATVEDGKLTRVAGDPAHPFTGGFLCSKVNRYPERVHSPARVLTPLRRVGPKGAGSFEPISWDDALGEIARRWQEVQAGFGSEALLGYAYSGSMGLVNRNIVRALFHALGASRLLAGTVCDSALEAGWEYSVGATPGTDPESIVDSDLVLIWGANVVTTNLHLVPFIEQARARGAKLVVVDPYRNRTARRADWHLAPRVGTDAALALGVMHVLVRDGLHDAAFVASRGAGFAEFAATMLPQYTPDRVGAITGVRAADVERLAHLYGKARAPFLKMGMAMSRHSRGGMAIRTVALLPAVVGAWGKQGGGALMDTGAAWNLRYDALRRPDLLKTPTREINHSTLGRDLLELKDPPVMALFVAGNNPAVTCPDAGRVVAGLSRDDLFAVVHDTFLTDTARYADIVLPACTAMESEDLYRSYGTYYAQYGPQVLEPLGESRSNLWVVQQLAARMGLEDPVFRLSTRELFGLAVGPESGLDLQQLLAGGPVRLEHGQEGPPVTWFYSEAMARDGLPGFPEWQPDPMFDPKFPLRLLTAPGHAQHHTAFDGVESLHRADGAPRCLLHPADAGARGIADGDPVELWNELGKVGLHARVTEDTQPGLVVVEGHRNQSRYLSGGPINALTSDRLADMGGGATFQSTWVDARRLGAAK